MTIVELCFSRAWGGLEHNCAWDAWLLRQRGHEVIPITRPNSPLARRFVELGLTPVSLRACVSISPLAILRLWRLFKRRRVEALHLHRASDLMPSLTAAHLAGVPNRVLTLRMESRRIKKGLYCHWSYGRLTAVLPLTDRLAERAKANLPVEPALVKRLYNGMDVDSLREAADPRPVIRQRCGIPQDAFVAGVIGRIETGKGQHLLVKAAASLRTVIPKLYVMIVGEKTVGQTSEIDRLKMLIQEMGMEDRVVFISDHPFSVKATPAFDVLVEALKKETFGAALIEAQALGIPAIGADGGGVPEIIEHEKNGLLFQPDDYEDLAEKLYQLFRNHRLRADLGRQAEAIAREKFSVTRHIEGLEAALAGRTEFF